MSLAVHQGLRCRTALTVDCFPKKSFIFIFHQTSFYTFIFASYSILQDRTCTL